MEGGGLVCSNSVCELNSLFPFFPLWFLSVIGYGLILFFFSFFFPFLLSFSFFLCLGDDWKEEDWVQY